MTDDLARDRLPRANFEQLMELAAKLGNPRVAQELRARWKDPVLLAEQGAKKAADAAAVPRDLAAMLLTSGFDFQGHRITRYLGFTSREVVMGMGLFRGIGADFADFFGVESDSLGQKLNQAKDAAFERLKRSVLESGGNAVIGVDLDYTMFGTSLVGVIASGTAVVIEPAD